MPRLSLLAVMIGALCAVGVAGAAPTRTYRIPSESMVPTLRVGQVVTVDLGARTPRRGDIVILHPPVGAVSNHEQQCGHRPPPGAMCDRSTRRLAKELFVKRVVALGGDRVELRRCHLVRNGVVLAGATSAPGIWATKDATSRSRPSSRAGPSSCSATTAASPTIPATGDPSVHRRSSEAFAAS